LLWADSVCWRVDIGFSSHFCSKLDPKEQLRYSSRYDFPSLIRVTPHVCLQARAVLGRLVLADFGHNSSRGDSLPLPLVLAADGVAQPQDESVLHGTS